MDVRTLTLAFALLTSAAVPARSGQLDPRFLRALHLVEASGRTGPILGDGGRALGPLQIHRDYWLDAGVPGRYSDVARLDYAERVVAAYLQRYAPRALARGDWQTLARVHNGGPAGARNPATRAYWKRVERHLCHKPK
jgi:hypothetical protein